MQLPYFLTRQARLARRYSRSDNGDKWQPAVLLKNGDFQHAIPPTKRGENWLLNNGQTVKTEEIVEVGIGRLYAGYD